MNLRSPYAADDLSTVTALPVVDECTDRFTRHVATFSEGRCLVLFDPSVRDAFDDQHDGSLLRKCARTAIPVRHTRFPRSHFPYLLELDLASAPDRQILHTSVRMAWQDRSPAVIGRGQGHRVAGWLTTREPTSIIVKALADHTIQWINGTRVPFRFYDARGLAWLWPLLRPSQQRALLGPVTSWSLFDAAHEWRELRPPTDAPSDPRLELDEAQQRAVPLIGVVSRALARHQHDRGEHVEADQLPLAWTAAERASRYGLSDPDDMAAMVLHALQWHPLFDTHPEIQKRLNLRADNQFYRAVVSDLEPSDFQRIQDELLTRSTVPGGH